MKLSYVVKNNTDSDQILDPGEAWQWIVTVEDEFEAYSQIEKVKLSAKCNGHEIMNVYLNDQEFDARAYWTDGANSDDFEYDAQVAIANVTDETK